MSQCMSCDRQFEKGEIIIPCSCCGDLYHGSVECTGVSASEQKVFALRSVKPMLVYRCKHCIKLGGNSVFINAVTQFKESVSDLLSASERIKTLVAEVEDIKNDVKNLKESSNEIAALRDDVTSIQNDNVVVVADIKALKVKVDRVISAVDKLPSIEEIESEIQDRVSRNSNIILYNVVEPKENAASADLTMVKELLAKINNINASSIAVRRLGKPKKDVLRPLLVTLATRSDVFRVIAAHGKLPTGIKVATDKTKLQREMLKHLYQFVDVHNSKSENKLTVKYVNNIPKTVPVSSVQSAQSKNGGHNQQNVSL